MPIHMQKDRQYSCLFNALFTETFHRFYAAERGAAVAGTGMPGRKKYIILDIVLSTGLGIHA